MGVASLLAPMVMPRLLARFTPGKGRYGKALVAGAIGSVAVTAIADRVARRAGADDASPTANRTGRRRLARAARPGSTPLSMAVRTLFSVRRTSSTRSVTSAAISCGMSAALLRLGHQVVAAADGHAADRDRFAEPVGHPAADDIARREVAAPDSEAGAEDESAVAAAAVDDVAPHAAIDERLAGKLAHVGQRGIVRLADDDAAARRAGKEFRPFQERGVGVERRVDVAADREIGRPAALPDRAGGCRAAEADPQPDGAERVVNGPGVALFQPVAESVVVVDIHRKK